jgi:hypothetical protein
VSTTFIERRAAAAVARSRRAEDLSVAVDILVRYVPPIDDLIRALEAAGGGTRLVKALRAELAARRGRRA